MKQLTNKEKAQITYDLSQKRKQEKEKTDEQLIKNYIIQRSFKYNQLLYKRNKLKKM